MPTKSIKKKLGLLLSVPLIAILFATIYAALDWLLIERMGWIALDRELLEFWIPFGGGLALELVFVESRLSILKFKENSRVSILFTIVATAVIAVPAGLSQAYIHHSSGTLERVTDIANVADESGARYYKADNVCLDRANAAVNPAAEVEGRSNDRLAMMFYVAVPLCEHSRVWIGLIYNKSISNRLSNAEKDAQFKAFAESAQAEFNAEDPRKYSYFERLRAGAAFRGLEKAIEKNDTHARPILLVPNTESFDTRVGEELPIALGILLGGSLLWAVMILLAKLDASKIREDSNRAEKGQGFFAHLLFVPTKDNWGLPLLLDLNVLVYLAMVFSGLGVASFQTDDLRAWGGNYGPDLHGIGFLRLITNQFVHAGLMHVANNMYGLIFAAIFLMPVARNGWLVATYLLCGLMASVGSTFMHPNIVAVGASGAIFGLFGVLLSLSALGDKRLVDMRKPIFLNAAIFIGLNLLIGAATPMIDNAAHIGGLICGLILGLLAYLTGFPKEKV